MPFIWMFPRKETPTTDLWKPATWPHSSSTHIHLNQHIAKSQSVGFSKTPTSASKSLSPRGESNLKDLPVRQSPEQGGQGLNQKQAGPQLEEAEPLNLGPFKSLAWGSCPLPVCVPVHRTIPTSFHLCLAHYRISHTGSVLQLAKQADRPAWSTGCSSTSKYYFCIFFKRPSPFHF